MKKPAIKEFASTDTFIKLLENDELKRLVMENEVQKKETTEESIEPFEMIFENYMEHASHTDNYDYFARRK